ncbi:neural cell adhesion molecule L1 isoform X2 [Latimeria chalumnae]|uniref:neural cell adhesion molecule L1 isoform X2 n=1 Tax=Latimeria chalumnae TaxID=7897 RepID=UPI00313DFFA6
MKGPPVITEQSPDTYFVFPSDDILLKCEATGNPAPMFRWTKNGKIIDLKQDPRIVTKANSGTFSIANNNGIGLKSYQGKYRCYAANDLGTAISTEINLIVESAPKWPKDKVTLFEVEEGDSVVLPCNPPVTEAPSRIYWMGEMLEHIAQDSRVSQGLNGDLYFTNVLKNDSRKDLMCHFQFLGARTISQKEPIELKVLPSNSLTLRKPRLLNPTGESSRHLVLRGTTLQLECFAEGLPTPKIHWKRLDDKLPKDRFSEESFSKILRIENVTESDDGEYQCIVENTEGTVKHSFSVTVEAAPYWIEKPKNGNYAPEEDVVLECEVGGIPRPSISWKINGTPLDETDPDPALNVKDGTLYLSNAQMKNTAVFQCEATNKHGSILANAYIFVLKLPPQILNKNNMHYVVVEKQTAFLECRAFGLPFPELTWNKEDIETVTADSRYSILHNGTLKISDVQKDDIGLFFCTTSNELDNTTITATLDVKDATKVEIYPVDQRVRKLDKATFECDFYFDPSIGETDVKWKKDGIQIEESDDSGKYVIETGTLTIFDADEKDKGNYTCVGSTLLDEEEATAELVLVDRPDPPTNLKLDDKKDRSVRLSWTPGHDHNSKIEEFIVEFQEELFGRGQWHKLKRVDGSLNHVHLTLSPYAVYQFRVLAVNEFGKSNSSAPSEKCKTPPAEPDVNPVEVEGEGSEPSNMNITWKPLRGLDWNGPNFLYRVTWRQKGKENLWHTATTENSWITVNNTPPFVPYEITVQSINEMGPGPVPEIFIGHSGEDEPQAYPVNVAVEFINSTSIRVVWSAVPKEDIRGHLGGYKVYYWRSHSLLERGKRHTDSHVVMVRGEKTHVLLSNLEPFSKYILQVTVFNGKEEGPRSPRFEFKTPEGVPSSPMSLHLENLSEMSVKLTWDPPLRHNGILTEYLLQYQQFNETDSSSLIDVRIDKPKQSSWILVNLDPKGTYRFYLRARTSIGYGQPIIKEESITPEVPPALLNISHSSGKTHINISWITREGHRNVEFQIHYRNKNSKGKWKISDKVNSTQAFYKLQDLNPGTEYQIKFVARNRTTDVSFWETEVETEGPALKGIHDEFATQGWFIGLASAIALLLLILLIICFIKRNKGGKYSVKDKEEAHVDSEARPMKDETFGEYSDNEEKPFTSSQPSLNGDIKPLGSDDSLADYGGSVDVQFNEDGSFIGQYSGKKEKDVPGGNDSSGATSPVNAVITLE